MRDCSVCCKPVSPRASPVHVYVWRWQNPYIQGNQHIQRGGGNVPEGYVRARVWVRCAVRILVCLSMFDQSRE